MTWITIQTSLYYIYTEKEKDSFPDLVGSSYNIRNQWLLEKGEDAFSIVFDFTRGIINHVKSRTNREKPAIGVEPMTIALQMRCSNLWAKRAHITEILHE